MDRAGATEVDGSAEARLEADLVTEMAAGSEPALRRLYDRFSRILYSLIVGIVRDSRDAEEVLQEVFLQAWKQADRFDASRGNVYRWLVNLARSRAIDRLRSKNFAHRRKVESSLDLLDSARDPTAPSQLNAVMMNERADFVRSGLGRIAPEQLEVMRLSYFLGYTQSEIARRLEIPLGTVKSRMRLGLAALRERLGEGAAP